MENKKECLHEFESVYYGSEWAVECKKCGKDIYDIHEREDANKVINERILKGSQETSHQKKWWFSIFKTS